jgi:hypothetical protein
MGAGGEHVHVDPRRATRLNLRDESGNIFVLFSVLIPIFVVVCAIVIDVGYWWVNAKKAQVAADACALAAAGDPGFPKPYDLDHCRFGYPVERDYVRTNLHLQSDPDKSILHKSTAVIAPYDEDPKRVEATVKIKVNTFFGTYVGLDYVDIERRAVAELQKGANEVTIHGHDTNCGNDNIKLNGLNITIGGILESNGKLIQDGLSFQSGPATAGGPGGCLIDVDPGGNFGGQPSPTNDPTIHPWPAYFVPWEDGLTCDFTGTNLVFGDDEPAGSILDDQIYCAHESIEVTQRMSGKVTFIAPEIKINAENTDFAPSTKAMNAGKPLLFFALANNTTDQGDDDPDPYCQFNKEMKLNGIRAKWTGIIFNPCSRVVINGDENSAITSLVEGMSVEINGANFTINNFPDAGGPTQLALWE